MILPVSESKTLEFMGTLISSVPDEDGYGYVIQTTDPWGNLHHFKESDDLYPTQDDALAAGKEFVDNYEPDVDPLDFDYAAEMRYVMSNYQKLK